MLVAAPAQAIDGGTNATGSTYGFVAEIYNGGFDCTGSLIHPSWVLTAVHCVQATVFNGSVSVRVGNTTRDSGGEWRQVTQVVLHPSYIGGHNDVALLRLSSPITNITPVPLAAPADAGHWDGYSTSPFTPYDDGVAVGWGQNATGALPGQLQAKPVSITPLTNDDLGIRTINVTGGPCAGDSGGPLLVSVNGAYVQAGVVKGADCKTTGNYSDVGAGLNREWILSQLTSLPFTSFGTADWDNDGHQDIITRQDATGDLWLYPGQSTTGYSSAPRALIGIGWRGMTSFGVGDYDRDGYQDIIARQDATGDLWLYPGQGRRSMSSAARVRIGTYWQTMTPFGVSDWDANGTPDIVARDSNGDLWVYVGSGSRSALISRYLLGSGLNGYSPFGVTRWDADPAPDLLVRNDDTGDLFVYPGPGARGPLSLGRFQIGNGWTGFSSFGATDWDHDGHRDILARHDATGDLWLYRGQSTRGYSPFGRVQIGNGW